MADFENNIEKDFAPRLNLGKLKDGADRVRQNISSKIVGQKKLTDLLLTALLADGHVLLEGVPGIAKTLIAKILAKSIAARHNRVQFTPDLMPSDILGTSVFNPKSADFELKKGPVFTNILHVDEINRSPAKTQAALFESMEERQITIDGLTHTLEQPFFVIATQNPIEQEGTYRLPEAQLDRFIFKIDLEYPNLDEEVNILKMKHANINHSSVEDIHPVIKVEELAEYKKMAHEVRVNDKLMKYIAEIITQTRSYPGILLGGSPRASIYLMAAAKAFAAVNGRDFISPEDVQFLTPYVLRHRLILTPEKEMEGTTADAIIREILKKIEVPR